MKMDTIKLLPAGWQEYSELQSPNLWHRINQTPAHTFYDFVALLGDRVYSITCRDSFNQDLFAQIVSSLDTSHAIRRPIEFSSTRLKHKKFDAIAMFPANSHEKFLRQSESLWSRTIVVSPIARFEFFGTENSQEIHALLRRFVTIIDWSRSPEPILKMRYGNPKTQSRSRQKGRGFARMNILEHEIRNLEGVEDGFLEFETFLGNIGFVQWVNGSFKVESKNGKFAFDTVDSFQKAANRWIISGSITSASGETKLTK